MPNNLMMACAVRAAGFEVLARHEGGLSGAALIADLSLFKACCTHAAGLWEGSPSA
ncbi:MAG: hypothetical protein HXY22_03115 [Alphaproteobacteria bacterium]|nr:hypothetical protein [Alphaproteobacteria bacterium]